MEILSRQYYQIHFASSLEMSYYIWEKKKKLGISFIIMEILWCHVT
jgi:hypothetical protein